MARVAVGLLLVFLAAGLFAVPVAAAGRLRLPVERISQLPELPNGCEVTSLAMLLQYWGFAVTAAELAEGHLPRAAIEEWQGPDPEVRYIGDPWEENAWYCWEGPIIEAAESWLGGQVDGGYGVWDLTGTAAGELRTLLDGGIPVAVWVTTDWQAPRYSKSAWWYLPSGRIYVPYGNVHCVVLTGYDEGGFFMADPLHERRYVHTGLFSFTYGALGSRAVAIVPAGWEGVPEVVAAPAAEAAEAVVKPEAGRLWGRAKQYMPPE